MTTDTPATTETTLTDEEVATLNEARTILKDLGKRCTKSSWDAPLLVHGKPNAADYGRVHALADVAENDIFMVLNWANCHNVRTLTDQQLHNRTIDEPQLEDAV